MNSLSDYVEAIQNLPTNKRMQLRYIREARQAIRRGRIPASKFELAQFHTVAMTVCTARSERWLHRRQLSDCNLEPRAFLKCVITAHKERTGSDPHPITLEISALGMVLAGPYAMLRHGRI